MPVKNAAGLGVVFSGTDISGVQTKSGFQKKAPGSRRSELERE